MKRVAAFLALSGAFGYSAAGQTLPELFQKVKAQVRGESWQDALRTLDALEAEAARPGNETARQQLAAPAAFYRGVCEANLGQVEKATFDFETFLSHQPGASLDPSMYSKKAVAAFEAAKRNAAPPAANASGGGTGSMFRAFQEFKLPPNSGEPVNRNWADGPVTWLLTAEEKRTWSRLESGAELQEFVDRFWESRNPRPGNPDNFFRTSFERRVAYADVHFAQAEGTRGSMTDRGRVFVLLGPPSYASRRALRAGEDANEAEGMSTEGSSDVTNALKVARADGKLSAQRAATALSSSSGTHAAESSAHWRETWHYPKELLPREVRYAEVDIEFVTKGGYGVGVLQRSTKTLITLEAARGTR